MEQRSGLGIAGDGRGQGDAFLLKAHLDGALESWICSAPSSVYLQNKLDELSNFLAIASVIFFFFL